MRLGPFFASGFLSLDHISGDCSHNYIGKNLMQLIPAQPNIMNLILIFTSQMDMVPERAS